MSEAVVRAERALFAYVASLQGVLHIAAEDALPQSLWEEDETGGVDGGLGSSGHADAPADVPDTLLQRLERETATEQHRVHHLLRRRLAPQLAALRASIIQLGGGQDPSGALVDVPVDTLDQEIAVAAAENAELGRRMVELYDEAAELAARIEREVMSTSVPSP